MQTPMATRLPDSAYPLYDPRFEHDACGVGFVADAGRHSRHRVLDLALTGLANLGHRGAFAADGESSDGAGVSLPLEPALVRHLLRDVANAQISGRPGVLMLFLPVDGDARQAARVLVEQSLAAEGLAVTAWREVPVDPTAIGSEARATLPHVAQAFVAAPSGSRLAFERALLLARRRIEIGSERDGVELAICSASSRSVVYKGLVAGGRLAALFPDLSEGAAAGIALSHAVFHQRYATNTRPTWKLAQPFRLIAHNGEINTVRGNREELRGRAADLGGAFGERLAEIGPILSADGSDSFSLDEGLDLLLAAGWRIDTALALALPDAPSMRERPLPEVDAFRARTSGLISPWDGPAALAFTDGYRVGVMLDRNGLRPAAVTLTTDRLVAAASEAGAVPIAASETADRLRLGPGQMLVVEPRLHAIRTDADAKKVAVRRIAPSTARRSAESSAPIAERRHVLHDDFEAVSTIRTAPRTRWLAGLD